MVLIYILSEKKKKLIKGGREENIFGLFPGFLHSLNGRGIWIFGIKYKL